MKVAIVPARGGSKRIPRKNIRDFLGRPIIAYSIQAAHESGIFDRVIVSTDDEEIADVALSQGAEVPFLRPATLADDYTGTNAVVRHALTQLEKGGDAVEYACCIYATAPFVRAGDLRRGLEALEATGKSFAFSVTTFPYPVQRALMVDRAGTVRPIYPLNSNARSQDLIEAYHDAGQFYWGRSKSFVEDISLFSPESLAIILPRYLVQDIDTLEDWKRAEFMYKALQSSGDLPQ